MAEVSVRTISDENFEDMGDRMRGRVQGANFKACECRGGNHMDPEFQPSHVTDR